MKLPGDEITKESKRLVEKKDSIEAANYKHHEKREKEILRDGSLITSDAERLIENRQDKVNILSKYDIRLSQGPHDKNSLRILKYVGRERGTHKGGKNSIELTEPKIGTIY